MGEDHRPQQADSPSDPFRKEERQRGDELRREEDRSKGGQIQPKSEVEVVRQNALSDEAAAERVHREEGGELGYDGPPPRRKRGASGGAGIRLDARGQIGVECGTEKT